MLLVFPPAVSELSDCLKVPSELRSEALVVALLSWKLTTDQYRDNEWTNAGTLLDPNDCRIPPELVEKIGTEKLTTNPLYSLGLRLHQFTVADYEFWTRSPRSYCVWYQPTDGLRKEPPGFESKSLLAILGAWKAERKGYKENVRAIFIHVGALKTVHKLEALAMRRNKRPDLRFYSYGTHSTVSPERWGLREIWPIGLLSTMSHPPRVPY